MADVKVEALANSCYGDSDYTSANGEYAIAVDGPGAYLVKAGGERKLATVPPNATGMDFTYGTYTVSGTVRDSAGQPVAGANVYTTVDYRRFDAYTDTGGHYALSVPPASTRSGVSRSGYASPWPRSVTVPPDRSNVDFVLPAAGYRILGLVLDSRNQPVSYAEVRLTGPDGSISELTSSCGAYEFTVPAGTYAVTVSCCNYVSPSAQIVTVPPEHLWLNFTLGDLPVIAGVVRDHDGSPLQGAKVRPRQQLLLWAIRTDTNGAYQIKGRTRHVSVDASKSGYAAPPEQLVTVPPDRTDVNFTFPVGYTVRGYVRDGGGRPLANASVSLKTCGEAQQRSRPM